MSSTENWEMYLFKEVILEWQDGLHEGKGWRGWDLKRHCFKHPRAEMRTRSGGRITAKGAIITLRWKQIIGCGNRELNQGEGLVFSTRLFCLTFLPLSSRLFFLLASFSAKRTNQVTKLSPEKGISGFLEIHFLCFLPQTPQSVTLIPTTESPPPLPLPRRRSWCLEIFVFLSPSG